MFHDNGSHLSGEYYLLGRVLIANRLYTGHLI